jgi:hypothetical protein
MSARRQILDGAGRNGSDLLKAEPVARLCDRLGSDGGVGRTSTEPAIALRGALRRLLDHCRSAFRTTHLALPPSTPESLAAIGANPAHAQRCIGQQWGLDRHEQRRHRRQLADRCKCNDGHCSLTISISSTVSLTRAACRCSRFAECSGSRRASGCPRWNLSGPVSEQLLQCRVTAR